MAAERNRGSKTQSLSLRLDPKTKFILDFMSRIKGQSITTLVERAIKEVADKVVVGPPWDGYGNEPQPSTWIEFWDPDEGIRTLKLLADPNYPTTFDEDDLRSFTVNHWQFFYVTSDGQVPRRGFIHVLWPNIDRYMQIWREQKSTDYWAAGEAMKADLSAARVAAPQWPPERKPAPEPELKDDLSDEIPF